MSKNSKKKTFKYSLPDYYYYDYAIWFEYCCCFVPNICELIWINRSGKEKRNGIKISFVCVQYLTKNTMSARSENSRDRAIIENNYKSITIESDLGTCIGALWLFKFSFVDVWAETISASYKRIRIFVRNRNKLKIKNSELIRIAIYSKTANE